MAHKHKKKLPPAQVVGVEQQPLMNVVWLPRSGLRANNYNPNHVAPVELNLLKISLLSDGWTQPIVLRSDEDEIVDGFHRWLSSGEPVIEQMTGGLVPTVRLKPTTKEHQMMSTIRHNRARGTHGIVKMAVIVKELVEGGMPFADIILWLQMEMEEVERLNDHLGVVKRVGKQEFNDGWVPE